MRIVPDENAAFTLLKSGELDIYQSAAIGQYDALKRLSNVNVSADPGLTYEHLDFNMMKPKLKDKRVRQAIAYSINRKQISEKIYAGLYPVAYADLCPMSWAYPKELENSYAYKPEKAKQLLDEAGWADMGPTIVMTADLANLTREDGVDHLPSRDVGRFVDARIRVAGDDPALKPGLTEIINAIKPETGLFIFEEAGLGPTAVALAVQDNDLAGILQLGVTDTRRGQGTGTAILHAALRWAKLKGARQAWVQVEAHNAAAVALYRRAGFKDVYRYSYRGPKAA